MTQMREIRVISDSLETGYVILASDESYEVKVGGNMHISGNLIYQTDDDSLAHDLFGPARLTHFESLGGKIKTVFLVISRALQGLIESREQSENDPDL